MATITDNYVSVPSSEIIKLREDVSLLAQAIERMQLENRVLTQLLPNLVDMGAALKSLKQRFKDLNTRVSAVELIQNEVKDLQKRVDLMGSIVFAPKPSSPPSPAPGIYT